MNDFTNSLNYEKMTDLSINIINFCSIVTSSCDSILNTCSQVANHCNNLSNYNGQYCSPGIEVSKNEQNGEEFLNYFWKTWSINGQEEIKTSCSLLNNTITKLKSNIAIVSNKMQNVINIADEAKNTVQEIANIIDGSSSANNKLKGNSGRFYGADDGGNYVAYYDQDGKVIKIYTSNETITYKGKDSYGNYTAYYENGRVSKVYDNIYASNSLEDDKYNHNHNHNYNRVVPYNDPIVYKGTDQKGSYIAHYDQHGNVEKVYTDDYKATNEERTDMNGTNETSKNTYYNNIKNILEKGNNSEEVIWFNDTKKSTSRVCQEKCVSSKNYLKY